MGKHTREKLYRCQARISGSRCMIMVPKRGHTHHRAEREWGYHEWDTDLPTPHTDTDWITPSSTASH